MIEERTTQEPVEERLTLRVVWAQSPVADVVRTPAPAVEPSATLVDVMASMDAAGTGLVRVGDDGVVTDRLLLRAVAAGASVDDPVAAVLDLPVAVDRRTTVAEACSVMLVAGVDHVLVRDPDGAWVLALRDLAAVLLDAVEPALWLATLHDGSPSLAAATELWIG